jgi:CRP/FNR family transcriptional regulator
MTTPNPHDEDRRASERTAATLRLLADRLAPKRRVVHAGDVVCAAGERFDTLYVLTSGSFKMVDVTADGREHVVSLKFRGDWLGFDGIASGTYRCDAVALDTGEVLAIRYADLVAAGASCPELLTALHEAMSREIGRERDSLMSVCTLPANARVAEFLRCWADSLARSGLRCDQIVLRLTRAEIGNYLGMTLETVSRALSKLARDDVIEFPEKGRRDIRIADVGALSGFIQRCLEPTVATALQ